jgi:hypothetical protein
MSENFLRVSSIVRGRDPRGLGADLLVDPVAE